MRRQPRQDGVVAGDPAAYLRLCGALERPDLLADLADGVLDVSVRLVVFDRRFSGITVLVVGKLSVTAVFTALMAGSPSLL